MTQIAWDRTASPERPYLRGIWGYPQPVRSRIPSQPADQSAGQARAGAGTVRSRDSLDAPGDSPPGKSSRTPRRDGQARSAPAWCRDHVSGRAPRIASASIPARVLAAGAGDVRSVPDTGELPAGLDDVFQARAGLARRLAGQPQAQPAVHAGPPEGLRLVPGRSPGSWAPKLPSST